jgi:hypothetical protein
MMPEHGAARNAENVDYRLVEIKDPVLAQNPG